MTSELHEDAYYDQLSVVCGLQLLLTALHPLCAADASMDLSYSLPMFCAVLKVAYPRKSTDQLSSLRKELHETIGWTPELGGTPLVRVHQVLGGDQSAAA